MITIGQSWALGEMLCIRMECMYADNFLNYNGNMFDFVPGFTIGTKRRLGSDLPWLDYPWPTGRRRDCSKDRFPVATR